MERDTITCDAESDRKHSRRPQIQEIAIENPQVTHERSPQRSLTRSVIIVVTCTAAMAIETSNLTSVNIALSSIGNDLGIREDQLQWLLSAYALSSGCLLLFFGRLADLYGRKKAFLIGMLWQTGFALGSGFANNGMTLIVFRSLQGMGVAAAVPSAMGILAHSFPPSHARSVAFATFATGAPLGGAFGMYIGGVVTHLSSVHWRAIFYVSAALSALCVLGCFVSSDLDTNLPEDGRVDWTGAILITGGLVLIFFVLGQAPIVGWKTRYTITCLVTGVVLLGIFVIWERHLEISAAGPDESKSFWTPPPLMKVSLWARAKGRMTVILLVTFLTCSGFISWIFWVQLYYQDYLGLPLLRAMVRFIPMLITGCICNFLVAMVVGKLPLVVFIVLGTVTTGFACVLFALIDPSVTYWAYGFPSTVMVVFGADFVYSAGTLFIAKIALPEEQSLAAGLFQTMTQIGAAFGLTISTFMFNSVSDSPSRLEGYRSAQWTNAACLFLAALLAAVFLRNVGVVGYRRQPDDVCDTIDITQSQI